MMIDIATENLITLAEASRLLPGRPSICTIWRWRTKGVGGRKLESVVYGGRVVTSVEALQRFGAQSGGTNAPVLRSPARREREIRAAEAYLAKAGI